MRGKKAKELRKLIYKDGADIHVRDYGVAYTKYGKLIGRFITVGEKVIPVVLTLISDLRRRTYQQRKEELKNAV